MSQVETNPARGDTEKKTMTSEDIVAKLKKSLSSSGDFPTSAKIVTELKALANNPATTANQIAEVILKEPSLGMRVLSLVNSSFYRPTKPITTISQAIIQIGMKPLVEMCSGLVLLQKFVPEARKNSSFALCIRRSVMTSLLASSLTSATNTTASKALAQRHVESGYLLGMMAEMGVLLLGFYFPQLYDSAVKRSESKNQDLGTSIKQLFGLSPIMISMEIIGSLGLPQYYCDALRRAEELASNTPNAAMGSNENLNSLARSLGCAAQVAEAVNTATDPAQLQAKLDEVRSQFKIPPGALQEAVINLSDGLQTHCDAMQISLPVIGLDLSSIVIAGAPSTATFSPPPPSGAAHTTAPSVPSPGGKLPPASRPDPTTGAATANFDHYVQDIRDAISKHEPTANIITSTMEACAYCLEFGRVVLLLANKERQTLIGRMALGQVPEFTPGKFMRSVVTPSHPDAPDYQAFISGQTITSGVPIFPGCQSFVAIPIGTGRRTVGVVYAERVGTNPKEISTKDLLALSLLASLLDKAVHRTP